MGADFYLLHYLKAILEEGITTTQIIMNPIIDGLGDSKNSFEIIGAK
jgi:DNA repair photolyase